MVILLNELAQKGYGVGNAISLFIVTNLGEQIKWKSMSPRTIDLGNGGEAASGRTCYGQSGSQSQHVLTSLMHFDVESLGSMAVYAVSTWWVLWQANRRWMRWHSEFWCRRLSAGLVTCCCLALAHWDRPSEPTKRTHCGMVLFFIMCAAVPQRCLIFARPDLSPKSKKRGRRLRNAGLSQAATAAVMARRKESCAGLKKKPASALKLAPRRKERIRMRLLVMLVQCGGQLRQNALYRLRLRYDDAYLRHMLSGMHTEHAL